LKLANTGRIAVRIAHRPVFSPDPSRTAAARPAGCDDCVAGHDALPPAPRGAGGTGGARVREPARPVRPDAVNARIGRSHPRGCARM